MRRLRALAGARRPGGDARRRPGPPARALLPPPVHERPPHRRPLRRARDAGRARVAPVDRSRSSPRAGRGRSTGRSTCCASGRCRCLARCGWASPWCCCSARHRDVRAVRGRDRARVGPARDGPPGVGQGLGPAAARQVRRPRRRTSRWPGCGASSPSAARSRARRRARSCSATRAGAGSRSTSGCSSRSSRRGGRVLIDRPARRLSRARRPASSSSRRRRTRSARATTRASSRPAATPSRYDAVIATVPNDIFEQLLDPRARRGDRPGLPRAALDDRVPHRALPAARARPPVHALLLDQHRRRRAAVRRPDRAHELHRARALRRPALPLRRQLPGARPRRCSALDARGAARPVRAGPAEGQPGASRATGSRSAGSSASRPRSRS